MKVRMVAKLAVLTPILDESLKRLSQGECVGYKVLHLLRGREPQLYFLRHFFVLRSKKIRARNELNLKMTSEAKNNPFWGKKWPKTPKPPKKPEKSTFAAKKNCFSGYANQIKGGQP